MFLSEEVGLGWRLLCPLGHTGNLRAQREKVKRAGSGGPVLAPCGHGPQGAVLRRQPCVRTFLEDVDDVVGVEAELVGVLRVIGVERAALRHLRLGLGLRLGPPSGWRRAARGLPADTADSTARWLGLKPQL